MATNSNAIKRPKAERPPKPYPKFPLSPHPLGRWQKRINGKLHYFGPWGRVSNGKLRCLPGKGGWKEALELYNAQADDLHAGRTPRLGTQGQLVIAGLCNDFLNSKLRLLESGEITSRTFSEYRQSTDRIVAFFGKNRPVDDLQREDFEALRSSIAKTWGPVRLGNEVVHIRGIFKYSRKSDLVPDEFKKPSAKVLRRHRAAAGKRLFSPAELFLLLKSASPQLKAMIMLGLNCGFGNSDVADLPQSAIDLDKGWVSFPRPKTGIDRRCPLWPETADAIRAALAKRPRPIRSQDTDCVFVTLRGNRWVRDGNNAVALQFGKLMRRAGVSGPKGLGFYSLRHTFRTAADGSKDFPAVRYIMGHVDASIDATYREHIEDERLVAVSDHVRSWLYAEKKEEAEL